METLSWIKDLVKAEQNMEEAGVIDFSAGFEPEKHLSDSTIQYLNEIKSGFIDAATTFNQLKGTPIGRIKIYGISNTEADFMLFRNGVKLIFSTKSAGKISIKFHFAGSGIMNPIEPTQEESNEESLLAKWGPFGDVIWTYNQQPVKLDFLIRYYMSRFVKESAK